MVERKRRARAGMEACILVGWVCLSERMWVCEGFVVVVVVVVEVGT